MAEKRKSPPVVATPRGVLTYNFFTKPDTKFDPEGVYKSNITIDAAKAAPLIKDINAQTAAKVETTKAELLKKGGKDAVKARKLTTATPYEDVVDKEGEPTGKVSFKTKVKAVGKNDKGETWSNKPPVFDKSGAPLEGAVYSGSEGQLSIQLIPYYMASSNEVGVTLRLKAARVTKLVNGNRDASSYGFEDDEDEDQDDAADEDTSEESIEGGAEDEGDDDF